ncbi:MAG: glycosyltransferase [Thermoplasmatales archaeon]|jgi:glycosyltransferase involved in cell wall biosynthesis|nr:glycosyltransferase [Candidatus Thermoplasmatota archaeon]MDA8054513.1 glycosyltransferase [Thermoplasmatales archaeon]
MEISILVTVKNDLNNIKSLLSSLKVLDDEFEIVIVDAFSTDGTYEYLQSEQESLNLNLGRKRGNRSVGRNECIRLAEGRKLIFLDADTEIAREWATFLRKNIDRDILAGKIIQDPTSRWSDLDRVPILYKGKDVTFPSNNLMYSRNVIEKIGEFDERFNTAEDIDLNIRAIDGGFEIFGDENVIVYHHPRQTYSSLLRQSYYDGIGRKLIQKKYGLKSSFNRANMKRHPFIESSRLAFGMLGYLFGGTN